jgi:radical SAM superfamily enzyme YgiQ (UPF0313 family)
VIRALTRGLPLGAGSALSLRRGGGPVNLIFKPMPRTLASVAGAVRAPGAVLLVSCYELGHQPAGLAVPLAFLERAGFLPASIDLAVERLDEARVRQARLVAIAVPMHTALRIGVAAARQIRRLNPAATVCFHGLYAVLNREHLLEGAADTVLGGESEQELVALAERLDRGEPLGAGPPIRLARLDFAVPSRGSLPPLHRYAALEQGGARRVAGVVEASRGCLHACRHCPIPPVYGGRFFVVPAQIVLEDIRRQVALGAQHISFADPDFLNGPGHSFRIVAAMHGEFPDLTFDFTAKVEHLLRHRHRLPELAAAGCAFVVTAVESLSDFVLEKLDKGHSRADVGRALEAVRAAGIAFRPSFLPFTPWTTLDDYIELVDWLISENLLDCVEPVQLAIRLLVPPGSALLGQPDLRPYLNGLDAAAFGWRWEHPDPRMERLHGMVTEIVHWANHTREDAALTFRKIRDAAYALAGSRPIEARATHAERRPVAPRLTEPWFC